MITDYGNMLSFVKETLCNSGKDKAGQKYQSFRSRFSHTERVWSWCRRLSREYSGSVNEYVLFVSAIFHDVGYALSDDEAALPHAKASAQIFRDYCKTHDVSFVPIISENISLHSDKSLLKREDTPIELILLMEADLLDETGALSILFDCMTSGERHADSYEAAYEHIVMFSCRNMQAHPMVTPEAIRIWEEKQGLVKLFVHSLAIDLNMDEDRSP